MKIQNGTPIGIGDIHGKELCIGDWIEYYSNEGKIEGQLMWDAVAAAVMICYPNKNQADFYYQIGHEAIIKIGSYNYIYQQ